MRQFRNITKAAAVVTALGLTTLMPCAANAQLAGDKSVASLIRQLDADQLAVRNAAEAELVASGPALLEQLEQIDARHWTSETRHRVNRIRNVLFQQTMQQAMQASRVTLPGDLSGDQISRAVLEQTGNRLTFLPAAAGEFPASDAEFWPWLKELVDGNQLQIDDSNYRELRLMPREENSPRPAAIAESGPLRLELLGSNAPAGGSASQLDFRLMWEPRIMPVDIRVPLAGLGLQDTDDQPWAAVNRQAVLNMPAAGRRFMIRFRVPLRQTSSAPLKTVDLPVQLVMLAPNYTARFDDIVTAGQFPVRRGGMARVSVLRRELQGRRLAVQVEARYDPERMAEPLQSHLGWSGYCSAELLHDNGQQVAPAEVRDLSQESWRMALEFLFDLPPGVDDNWKLNFTLPAGLTLIDETMRLSIDP